jgi:hypothetical protein
MEKANLQFRCDFFNITNSVMLGGPNNVLGNPNFGLITGVQNVARQIQFSMKLAF